MTVNDHTQNDDTHLVHTPEQAKASAQHPNYQVPRVTDMGAWQAVTLGGSVGVNRFPFSPSGDQRDF